MSTSWRASLLVAACVVTVGTALVASEPAGAATQPSRLVPLEPCRVLDTRETGNRLDGRATIETRIAGRCGVRNGAVAAVITVTAVDAAGPGYLTAFPTGVARPSAASLNYGVGDTVANMQIAQLGDDGSISVYARTATDVVVDVTGYFERAPGGTSADGRFVPVVPHRIVDTRETGRPRARTAVRVRPVVPDDAIAVAISITTTDTRGRGFFVAYPAGVARPTASNLNVDGAGQTRTGSAVVALGRDGFDVYTRGGDHVIVDLTGYFTGADAALTSDGLFVAGVPGRAVDTRLAYGPDGGPRVWDHGTRAFDITGLTAGPVAAVVATVVATDTEDRGHIIAYPAGNTRPLVSTVNYDRAGATVANSSLIATSDLGLAVYARESAHVVLDISGWFLGTPMPSPIGVPPNNPPPDRRVTIIGDSAAAGMRWNGALGGLRGFVANADLESCRRLVQFSCKGREGYNPRTVVAEIQALPPATPEEILVVATGYNDWHERFSSDFDTVVATARGRGFHHIAWVDYRTDVGYHLPGSWLRSNYVAMNAILATKVASGDFPEVRIWSLDTYTASATGWFHADGVHETVLGSTGVADWISRHVRAFDERPCAMPWFVGAPVDDPCPDPDVAVVVRGIPDIAALYRL